MLCKFTNASGEYRGDPLYINKDWIVTIFEQPRDGGSLVTIVWGGPTGIGWEVEESLEKARKIFDHGA